MPEKLADRRRKACHHEAGHAFVRWFFGFPTDRVVVLTVDQILAGRRLRTPRGNLVVREGMVFGADILCPPYGPRISDAGPDDQATEDRWRTYRRDIELIDCYAGFCAEARYGHVSLAAAALSGGSHDMERFRAVLNGWFPNMGAGNVHSGQAALEERVAGWARTLINSPRGRKAVCAVADAVHSRGNLSGRQIATLCRGTYGGRQCAFEAWAELWPPTIKQLKDGFIPE